MIFTYLCRHGIHGIWLDKNNQYDKPEEINDLKDRDDLAIHYHGKTFLVEDLENWTVVLSYRKDLFDQYCSYLIASYTNQYVTYDKKINLIPIRVDINHAVVIAKQFYDYPSQVRKLMLDHRPWKHIIEIAYEEIGPNYQGLFKKIPILHRNYNDQIEETSNKSPNDLNKFIHKFEMTKSIFKNKFRKLYRIKL